MRDNSSPEEKLLRLIRGQKKQEAGISSDKRTPAPAPLAKTRKAGPFLPGAQRYLPADYLNKTIVAGLIVSSGYVLVAFFYSLFGLQKIQLPRIPNENVTATKVEIPRNKVSFETYLGSINKRSIFVTEAVQQGAGRGANAVSAADAFKDINLVGIISGENPQVIIEDKKALKTYYVTKGQFVGDFLIEDIMEGKVIISYKGQRYELYL